MQLCIPIREINNVSVEQLVRRCAADPAFFIQNFVKAQCSTGDDIITELYDFQKDFISTLHGLPKDIHVMTLNAARQIGCTHAVKGYVLWHLIFRPNQTVISIHHTSALAKEFLTSVVKCHAELPEFLRPTLHSYTNRWLRFDNGASLACEKLSPNVGRGMAMSLIIVHDCAYYSLEDQNIWAELANGIIPCLASGGKLLLTTNGLSEGAIGDLCRRCRDDPRYAYLEAKWNAHPKRNALWKESMLKMCGKEFFAKYFECKDVKSGK